MQLEVPSLALYPHSSGHLPGARVTQRQCQVGRQPGCHSSPAGSARVEVAWPKQETAPLTPPPAGLYHSPLFPALVTATSPASYCLGCCRPLLKVWLSRQQVVSFPFWKGV